jgi:crotonobetainyl-CoA:carnitine CoA-transferase CaiB-like acyl-CoA transferase
MTAPPPAGVGPLAGIVVADFSRVLAGPYCTMLLADLGADVIKVESPAGDDTRHWVPPLRGELGTYYAAINRNKRSIVLDLADDPELSAGWAAPVRVGLRVRRGPQFQRHLQLDQRLRVGPRR